MKQNDQMAAASPKEQKNYQSSLTTLYEQIAENRMS